MANRAMRALRRIAAARLRRIERRKERKEREKRAGLELYPDPTTVEPGDPPIEIRNEYVALCTDHLTSENRESHEAKASREFDMLCGHPDIQQISVDVHTRKLFIGTTMIHLRKHPGDPWVEIGEFIITIDKASRSFCCRNITRTLDGFHHPHVNTIGNMCISGGSEEIKLAITDGELLHAARIILVALHTIDQYPYKQLADWNEATS